VIPASSIANIIKSTNQYLGLPKSSIVHVCIDSRSIFDPIDTVYFALIGPRNNGHQYIDDLYKMGVKHYIVEDDFHVKKYTDINYWKVENTTYAFQLMAKHIRNQVNIPIIGITGSNGKTIVKEWLFHGLRDSEHICRSPKSYNSQVGVPFSVWNLNKQNTLGIFEAGISKPDEMEKLAKIIKPTIGVFTHLGTAHQNNFKSLEEKANEKIKLFEHAEVIFYPADQTMLDNCFKKVFENNTQLLKAWSSIDKNAWMYVEEKFTNDACNCSITIEGQHHHVVIPFTQSASLNNTYACIATWHHLGLSWDVIQQKLNSLPSLGMRLELRKGANNCTIINDAYSLDLDSLQIALDLQHHHNEHNNKWVILSSLPNVIDEKQTYTQVANLLKVANINKLIVVGPEYKRNETLFSQMNVTYLDKVTALNDFLKSNKPNNATVLVKGARTFGFEKIVNQLEEFEHQTRLEINLNAIQHNLNMYRSLLKPNTKIMVMVKAFSYGSGAYEIAQWMEFNQVDYLAVAFTNEGVALRKNGIRTPILVLNAEPNSFAQMIEHRLEPEIYNQKSLTAFSEAVCQAAEVEAYPIHLKIETGMNRLGFTAHEIQDVIITIKENSTLKVASVFSHLAGSDEARHDDFTNQQISSFKTLANNIETELVYPIIKHIANSAAISRFPNAHLDMVRLGIGLYGFSGDKQLNDKLEVVAQLKTTITQIKQLNAGETIGYGRNFSVLKPSKIAVIPIGYADGLRRGINLVNGFVMINEKRANYVGNICMDMCMIDVTEINCQEGDEVIIFGHEPFLQDIATWYNTIPYEIISNISQRVKRIYFKD
jgi:alanine racemase